MIISLESIVGKVMLVGYTRCLPDGSVLDRFQRWGRVISADGRCIALEAADGRCIALEAADGQVFTLPPDLRSVQEAPPGTDRLHSTGEVIENPDLLSTWILEVEKDE